MVETASATPDLKSQLSKIPLLRCKAGPTEKPEFEKRLKEELSCLIAYIKQNKSNGQDWFKIECSKDGINWFGECWHIEQFEKYVFKFEFELPAQYPTSAPEICIPELEGKTPKMYRGGHICLTSHFHPLWSKNVPKFGIAHALALGLAPWLAAEIPTLIKQGKVHPVETKILKEGDNKNALEIK